MWKKISTKVLFEHPRITLVEDVVELPDGQRTEYLRWENISDAATIICKRGNEILLEREYSYPPNAVLWQFPGGKVDVHEEPLAAAIKRKLSMQFGFRSMNLNH